MKNLFLLSVLSSLVSLHAADWYVSGSGNNAWAGTTPATAFRTLARAATDVNPGDTVWIMNGIYAPVTLTRSGTAGARITWKAYPNHAPELRSSGWHAILVTASFQTIEGLILTGNNDNVTLAQAEANYNTTPTGAFNGNGITLDNRNAATKHHHLTVRNCIIRKFGGGGVNTIEADYTTIEGCDIYENAWYSRYGNSGGTIFPYNANANDPNTGYRNFIVGNRFWNNRGLVMWKGKPGGEGYSDGNGFIVDITEPTYAGRTLIANNLVFNNGGSGIHAYKGVRVDIVNNTGYHNGQVVGYPDIFAGHSNDVRIFNNIMYSRNGGRPNSNSNNTNVVYSDNVYFNGSNPVMGANDVVANPLFVNPSNNPDVADFRLQAGSPALNTGRTLAGVTPLVDILGVARPQGAAIDRGAYELAGADTTPPAQPAAPTANSLTSATPTLSGTTEPGANIRIFRDNVWQETRGSNATTGAWSWTSPTLAPGTYVFTVSAQDAAGNISTRSPGTTITVAPPADTTPPATPAAPTSSSTTSATPTLSGTTEAGATVRIFANGVQIGSTTANGSGAWSWTVSPALAAGTHNLTVRAVDAAGNVSGQSAAVTVTVAPPADTTPPAQPAAPTASSTTSPTPTLSGSTEANATVRIYADGVLIGTTTANGAGAWSHTISPALPPGTHVVTVTATDGSGNISAASNSTTIIVPAPPGSGDAGPGPGANAGGDSAGGCGFGSAVGMLLCALAALSSLFRGMPRAMTTRDQI